jgi:hypothetical protein
MYGNWVLGHSVWVTLPVPGHWEVVTGRLTKHS